MVVQRRQDVNSKAASGAPGVVIDAGTADSVSAMGVYLSDYIALSMEQDLAEDVGEVRGGVGAGADLARTRLVGTMRWDALVHGQLCLLDTTFFAGPIFTTRWAPRSKREAGSSRSTVLDNIEGLRTSIVPLLRQPDVRNSLLNWVFPTPTSVRAPVLHLAPSDRTSTINDARSRSLDVQRQLSALNDDSFAGRIDAMWTKASSRTDPAQTSVVDFVDAVLEPYRWANDLGGSEAIEDFQEGYEWFVGTVEAGRFGQSHIIPDVVDDSATKTDALVRRTIEPELPDDATDRADRRFAERLTVELSALVNESRPTTHSAVQQAINDALHAEFGSTGIPSALADLDRVAAISARVPRLLGRARDRLAPGEEYSMSANRILRIHQGTEAIRADLWRRRYVEVDTAIGAVPQMAFSRPLDKVRRIAAADPLLELGAATNDQFRQVRGAYRVALERARRERGAQSPDKPKHLREYPEGTRERVLKEVIVQEFIEYGPYERRRARQAAAHTAMAMFLGTNALDWPTASTIFASLILTADSKQVRDLVATTVRSSVLPPGSPR